MAPPRLAGIGIADVVSHQAAVALTGHSTRRVGTSVGLAVLSAVATTQTTALAIGGHEDQAHALVGGFARAFLVATGLATAAGLLGALTASTRRVLRPATGPVAAPAPSRTP